MHACVSFSNLMNLKLFICHDVPFIFIGLNYTLGYLISFMKHTPTHSDKGTLCYLNCLLKFKITR